MAASFDDKKCIDIRWKFRLSHVWNGQNIHNHSWCDVNLRCPQISPTTLLWYERWDSEAWRHMYLFKSYSVNWQSEKKNISLTRHPSYVFSTKRKGHTQKCMQPYQGRTSAVCQSHIALPRRNDTEEERRARELDQTSQDACHQAQLQPLVWYCRCPYRRVCALSKVSVASPMDGNGVKHSNSADFCLKKPNQPSETQKHTPVNFLSFG